RIRERHHAEDIDRLDAALRDLQVCQRQDPAHPLGNLRRWNEASVRGRDGEASTAPRPREKAGFERRQGAPPPRAKIHRLAQARGPEDGKDRDDGRARFRKERRIRSWLTWTPNRNEPRARFPT